MISSLSSILPSHISEQIQADRENCLQLEAEKWKKARMKQEKEERGEEEEVAEEENNHPPEEQAPPEEEEDEEVVKQKEKDRKNKLFEKLRNDVTILPNLFEIDLSRNKMRSARELEYLSYLKFLKKVIVKGNLFEKGVGEEYRLEILGYLPTIKYLDKIKVTEEEFEQARERRETKEIVFKFYYILFIFC
jgi:hypothetical protein